MVVLRWPKVYLSQGFLHGFVRGGQKSSVLTLTHTWEGQTSYIKGANALVFHNYDLQGEEGQIMAEEGQMHPPSEKKTCKSALPKFDTNGKLLKITLSKTHASGQKVLLSKQINLIYSQ